jgi:c-di-GMP-binding flagellar brake protein YcgR
MKERRKVKRAEKYFAVNIVSVDNNGKVLRFDKTAANPKYLDESGLDFSPEGIKIMCSKKLPKESKIQMKLLIPDENGLNLIKANGSVKWFRQVKGKYKKYFMIGVCFREIERADKKKLISLWKRYG